MRTALLLSMFVTACGGELAPTTAGEPDHGDWQPLIAPGAWTNLAPDDDPMRTHREGTIPCTERAWHESFGGIEVDTGACNYAVPSQPLTTDLRSGDRLRIRVWWQRLVSLEPVDAHLAILVDRKPIWEEQVPVPGPADTRELVVESHFDAPAGAPLTFHLHNHGFNAWQLDDLSLWVAEGETR